MRIITIVGPSGSGKDTVARMLSNMTGLPVLVSYTTRPRREGEENGREHWFVDSCKTNRASMLAYTQYGGYEYWTEIGQVDGDAIYVIDEKGFLYIQEHFPDIDIISIHVTATDNVRRERGVSLERIDRDLQRETLPSNYYDFRLSNNKSLTALKHKVKDLAQLILFN